MCQTDMVRGEMTIGNRFVPLVIIDTAVTYDKRGYVQVKRGGRCRVFTFERVYNELTVKR